MIVQTARRPHILQLLPLILTQDAAKAEQHARIGFFKFGASLCDAIDLRHHFRFIRMFRFEQRLHDGFFLLQRRLDRSASTGSVGRSIHASLLVGGEAQPLN